MPLLSAQLDTTSMIVARPTEYQPGGKRLFRVIHSKLRGTVFESSEMTQDPETREDKARDVVKIRIPAQDWRGRLVDINRGDMVTYVDFRGQDKQVIVRSVSPVRNGVGSKVNHLSILASG